MGVGGGGMSAGGAVRNGGDATPFPLLPPHALPQPQPPLHHLPHLSHPQVPTLLIVNLYIV